MIKQKYVIIFMVIYTTITLSFFVHASLLAPIISKLAPAAAAATGTGGGFTIPAKVLATTSTGANVAKWVSLAVPGLTAARVAGAILAIGGALAADYLVAKGSLWFAAKNISKEDGTGSIEGAPAMPFNITNEVTVPNGYDAGDYTGPADDPLSSVILMGIYDGTAMAAAARDAFKANTPECVNGTNGHTQSGYNYKGAAAHSVACTNHVHYWFCYRLYPTPAHKEFRKVPIPTGDVANKLANDLANENANAKTVAKAALEVAANAMDNPNHPVTTNVNTYNTINNYLTQNLTANQLSNLEAAATPNVGDQVLPDTDEAKADTLTAAQIAAAVAAALANQGLSATQIAAAIAAAQSSATGGLTQAELASTLTSQGLTADQIAAAVAAANPSITQTKVKTAVKEAIDDETDVTIPVDPTIVLPDKLSLTTVMNNFWTSVQALPIFNVLNGITITTSGSSNLCIDLPADYGGQRCYNGSNVQDELNMIGSVILGLTTVVSFIGIFKG